MVVADCTGASRQRAWTGRPGGKERMLVTVGDLRGDTLRGSREDVVRSPASDEGARRSRDDVSALGRHYRDRERAGLAGTVTRRRAIGLE